MRAETGIITILIALSLICSSCNWTPDDTDISKVPDNLTIVTSFESKMTSSAESLLSGTDDLTDGIKWTMDDIKMLNNISNVSVYKVSGDLANPSIKGELPEGTSSWDGDVTTLYSRGFFADTILSRNIYKYIADSQCFTDLGSVPQQLAGYAKDYDLLDTVEVEEYPKDDDAERMLREWGTPIDTIRYPVKHVFIRQQVAGIPTMPLRGNLCTEGGKLSYGDIKGGGTWTFSQSPVSCFDGEYAAEYLIIPNLQVGETIEKDLDVIPFEELKGQLRNGIRKSIIKNNISSADNNVKDITVAAAEVCYIMLYDNYAEYEKSNECYLIPFWAVYYKCGTESGLTQQNAAFFPAVNGVNYE